MTLQQQAEQVIQVLPDDKLPSLIQFARFLLDSSDNSSAMAAAKPKAHRKIGRLKGKIWMADDFNETPEVFKEYV